jgi:cysteine desulfurase/selenocysteine lyase
MNKITYLDAAASALKPAWVIRAEVEFLRHHYANSGRGICKRAAEVDKMVAHARAYVANFINADLNQVIFTSGATDGLNRIVNIITHQPWYTEDSTVAVSDLDHHSARLPWQVLLRNGKIKKMFVCELDENLDIKIDSIPKTDFFVITAMSNVLGRAQDVGAIIAAARQKNPNVITIVDASQYVAHKKIDVKQWDCDFMVFSGHKIGADTGVGVLYFRDSEKYFPDKFGGGMVLKVSDSEFVFNDSPEKWEAGTLPLTQIVGMVPAIEYLDAHRPKMKLIRSMYDELSKIPRVKIITSRDASILSFNIDNMHPLDVGAMFGACNICVRAGNMCASWIHRYLGIDGSVRVSVGSSNADRDVRNFIFGIQYILK